jgi:hypothetical protein
MVRSLYTSEESKLKRNMYNIDKLIYKMGILETRKNTLRPKKIWRDIEVT